MSSQSRIIRVHELGRLGSEARLPNILRSVARAPSRTATVPDAPRSPSCLRVGHWARCHDGFNLHSSMLGVFLGLDCPISKPVFCSPVSEAARRRDRRHWTPQMVRSSMASHLQICLAYTNDIIVSLLDRGRWLGATPSSGVSMPAGLVRVRLGNRWRPNARTPPEMERADMELDAVAMRRRFVPRASRPGGAIGPGSEIGVVLVGRMRARKRHGRPSGSLGLVVDGLPGMTRGQPGISRCLPARESRAQPLPTWAWSGFHGRALWRTGAGADIVTKRRVADGDGTAVDETEGKIRGVEGRPPSSVCLETKKLPMRAASCPPAL